MPLDTPYMDLSRPAPQRCLDGAAHVLLRIKIPAHDSNTKSAAVPPFPRPRAAVWNYHISRTHQPVLADGSRLNIADKMNKCGHGKLFDVSRLARVSMNGNDNVDPPFPKPGDVCSRHPRITYDDPGVFRPRRDKPDITSEQNVQAIGRVRNEANGCDLRQHVRYARKRDCRPSQAWRRMLEGDNRPVR